MRPLYLFAPPLGHRRVRDVRMMRRRLQDAMWEKTVLAWMSMEEMQMRALNAVSLWLLTMRSRASEG